MNPTVEPNLALILFLPWFLILGAMFWIYPRQPRSRARRVFDLASLALATAAAALGMHWGFYNADPSAGNLWRQVLATSVAYGLFLLVMTVAIVFRWKLFPAEPAK